ncbi:MAG: ABC transporter substrate-binding protein [Alicyclobacillus sp.]|nr:ABC transporter substrate-binding protein [Alicyclobacillus sp.]
MNKKHWLSVLALTSVAGLLLAGCGGGASGSSSSGGGGANAPAQNAASNSTAASGTSKPAVNSNTLVIADGLGDPQSWDPIATFVIAWGEIANNIFDGLVYRGPDLKIQPGLATSWTYKDPKTLEFTLRKGVKFQDGEPFNAEAVKFTFDRLLADKKSPQLSNYTSIQSVQVVDDYHVIFHLKTVDPVLITKLAGYGAMIVPPQYIKEHGDSYFANHPIGTGAYQVVDYKPGESVTLKANPDYWRGAPKIQNIQIKFVPDANTRMSMMQAGTVDIVEDVPPAQAQMVKSDPNFNLDVAGSPTVSEIRFDTSKPYMNNVDVRQAINYAIDKNAIIQKVLNGYGQPVSTFQGAQSFGNDPNLKPYPYDPQKAEQLLQKAGVPKGTTLTLTYDGSDSTFSEVAQAVQEELQQVGLNLKLQPEDTNTFYNQLIPQGKAGDMHEFGWGGWTLDFDNTAELLYSKGQFWNPDFSNPQITALLNQERSTNDQSVRQQAFYKMDQLLQQLAVEVPLYQQDTIWAVRNSIQGWVTPPDERMDLWDLSYSN